jgi:hypothetical protein
MEHATYGIFSSMPPKELDELLADLRAWAAQAKHGDKKRLADSLGLKHPQLINHWIAGRKKPTIGDGLQLQTFLKNWKRRRKQ